MSSLLSIDTKIWIHGFGSQQFMWNQPPNTMFAKKTAAKTSDKKCFNPDKFGNSSRPLASLPTTPDPKLTEEQAGWGDPCVSEHAVRRVLGDLLLSHDVHNLVFPPKPVKFVQIAVEFSQQLGADLRRRAGTAHEIYDVAQRPDVYSIISEHLKKCFWVQGAIPVIGRKTMDKKS